MTKCVIFNPSSIEWVGKGKGKECGRTRIKVRPTFQLLMQENSPFDSIEDLEDIAGDLRLPNDIVLTLEEAYDVVGMETL